MKGMHGTSGTPATPRGPGTSVTTGTSVKTGTIDVLVVDDDFMVARVHRTFVERVEPFRVVGVANTGEQAAHAVDELRPDLVLLDLYLPDVFGLDVIPRLRTSGHDCDVMVISAAREADTVRGAVRHGVVDYLLKPFEFEDLRARLERYASSGAACSPPSCTARPTWTGSWPERPYPRRPSAPCPRA
jgi:DNA-binding NarL/FixJ family response regulator